MSKNEDHRKMRTKEYLKTALISLMREKNVHNITVKDLCTQAQINRATFYAHYIDMDDFLQQIIEEMVWGVVQSMTDGHKDLSILLKDGQAYKCYCRLFRYLRDNAELFQLMLGENGLPKLFVLLNQQGIELFTDLLRTVMLKFEKTVPLDVLTYHIFSAHAGLLRYYLDSNMKYSPEYMAEQMTLLSFTGPMSLLQLLDCKAAP